MLYGPPMPTPNDIYLCHTGPCLLLMISICIIWTGPCLLLMISFGTIRTGPCLLQMISIRAIRTGPCRLQMISIRAIPAGPCLLLMISICTIRTGSWLLQMISIRAIWTSPCPLWIIFLCGTLTGPHLLGGLNGGGICTPMDLGTYHNFIKDWMHSNTVFYSFNTQCGGKLGIKSPPSHRMDAAAEQRSQRRWLMYSDGPGYLQ